MYINDKESFRYFFARGLSKRLIHGKSLSEDAEAHVMSALGRVCGLEYVRGFQRMLKG